LKRLIDSGHCLVDDVTGRPAQKLRPGQRIILHVPPTEPLSLTPEEMDLDVRYEDEHIIVDNKQQDLVVHPAPGHARGTLIHGILFGRPTAGGDPMRPGIVHRLDKDTSGLLVLAKRVEAHAALARQFHYHTVGRRYLALVKGDPPNKGEWNTLHGRHPKDRLRFSSKVIRGKRAISRFATAERFEGAALLRVTLQTGRTHQVRVHCHDHGFPILGDPYYGPKHMSALLKSASEMLVGQALHAELLAFEHPATGESMRFEAEPPAPFKNALTVLK
jgi:23S rRNA pseudouridine1911/1915/1917 synthase